MIRSDSSFRFRRHVVAMAVCAACVPLAVLADDEAKPVQATVSLGAGAVSGNSADRAQFGQYNGLRDRRGAASLDIDYNLRDESRLTWIQFDGSRLLGDTRDMNLVWKNPGSWKLRASYSELVRNDPNSLNTGLAGAGTASPQVIVLPAGPGTGSEFELKTKRTSLGVGFTKVLSPRMQVEIDLKTENKEGSRLFGTGMNCPSAAAIGCLGTTGVNTGWALLALPEPVKTNHSQVEARLSYGAQKFRLHLGYYGSYFRNDLGSINPVIPGSLNNPLGTSLPLNTGLQALLSQPVALAPDNQAHQLDLSGSYDLTPSTRATFKIARSTATQDESFAAMGLPGAPIGFGGLGGKVDTSLTKLGITSRPMAQLSLLADVRVEDKQDQTPLGAYNNNGVGTSTNSHLPLKRTSGKAQASWQFNSDYRGTLGADFETIDRGAFTASSTVNGVSALRAKTEENGVRAELRRRMSEEVSGSVMVSSSQRTGSNWLKPVAGGGVIEVPNPTDLATGFTASSIFMPTLADRKRDKVRVSSDWRPSEDLSLQFSMEQGKDRYTLPTSYGLQSTRMSQYGFDVNYAVNDKWNVNGYVTRGNQTQNQARAAGTWMAFDNTNTTVGLGVTGKASSALEVGAQLAYMDDTSSYAQTLDAGAGADSAALLAATGGLPNVVYRKTALRLYGKYNLDKVSSIRVDLMQQRWTVNDWAWGYSGVPFVYSDGTTVTQKSSQSVGFLGVTYTVLWQ